jgi:hypothetical protein
VDERVNGGEAVSVASAAETFELSHLCSPGCDGLLVLLPTRDDPLVHVGSNRSRFFYGYWCTVFPTRRGSMTARGRVRCSVCRKRISSHKPDLEQSRQGSGKPIAVTAPAAAVFFKRCFNCGGSTYTRHLGPILARILYLIARAKIAQTEALESRRPLRLKAWGRNMGYSLHPCPVPRCGPRPYARFFCVNVRAQVSTLCVLLTCTEPSRRSVRSTGLS